MATIELRAIMRDGDRIFGPLYDRFVVGNNAYKLNFAALPPTDLKRDFSFFDFVYDETYYANIRGANISFSPYDDLTGPKHKANDKINIPFFYSTCSPGHRHTKTCILGSVWITHVGYFKGPDPYLTIDNTGSESDFLPPGTMLLPSAGGLVHKIVPNGEIEVHRNSSFVRQQPFIINTTPEIQNLPMIIGHSQVGMAQNCPGYNPMLSIGGFAVVVTTNFLTRGDRLTFARFIGQDSSYIYFLQDWQNGTYGTAATIKVSASFLSSLELVSIKKSDGAITDITLPINHWPVATGGYNGLIYANLQEVMTTDAIPVKAIVMIVANKTLNRYFSVNKIVNNAMTNIATALNVPALVDKSLEHSFVGTQLMNNLNASYSDSWKAYYPFMGYLADSNGIIMMRLSKKLTGTPTLTRCTISGLPAEYASSLEGYIRPMYSQGVNYGNCCWAAEIYDGSDQYIAYWIGTVRAKTFSYANWVNYAFTYMSDEAYRCFLIFKVDPTDDTKLIYQSCVPEFKYAKPIYASVASIDNKQIVMADEDGIKVFIWSTASKSFVLSENIALPGVWSLSMDKTPGTENNTVWAEVVADLTNQHLGNSYLLQIDFGDYISTDIRYWDGVTYKEGFTSSMLTITQDVNGNFEEHSFETQVRVKQKTDGVETAFVANETVRLKITGAKESDEISFVGHDLNAPHQKTVTTTTDWLPITINYKYPFTNISITAERLLP